MEYINMYRFELAATALMKIMLFSIALLATFHMSCLVYESGCTPSIVAGIQNHPIEALRGELASLVSTFDSAGIYAFSAKRSSVPLARKDGMGDDTLKPLYNAKYLNDKNLLMLNVKLTKLWTSKEWRAKVSIFTDIFSDIMKRALLKPCMKALCIGAGKGHEVLALKEMGVYNSIGIDLVASPPLVMKGDMHSQPFGNDTFDFEFSNVYDHALFTSMFAAEIERTLKPGGCIAIHLMLKSPKDYKPGNSLKNVDVLIALFRNFDVVHVGDIDAFGLDTQVILRKPFLALHESALVYE